MIGFLTSHDDPPVVCQLLFGLFTYPDLVFLFMVLVFSVSAKGSFWVER